MDDSAWQEQCQLTPQALRNLFGSQFQIFSLSLCLNFNLGYKLPLKKGSRVGTLEICQGKEKVAEYDLVADRDVDRADFITTYIRLMKKLI